MPRSPVLAAAVVALLGLAPLSMAEDEIPAAAPSPSVPEVRPPGMGAIIVIDPGHGGADTGVKGAIGLLEKDLALAVAVRLKERLEANLGAKVILTRSGDFEVSPLERAAMANNNKAALFVSLHLGFSSSPEADDFTAFFNEPRPSRPQEEAQEHPAWKAWDAQNEPYRGQSRQLARAFQETLSDRIFLEAREPLGGDLLVLKGVGCPAAALELGCLSNSDRENAYREKSFMDQVAEALFHAVDGYLGGGGG